jgi:hypothetical protein
MSVEEFLHAYPNRDNAINYKRGRELAEIVSGRVCVFGVNAWEALGMPKRKMWEKYTTSRATFYLVPHPSGKCRLYNVKANRNRLRRLLCP